MDGAADDADGDGASDADLALIDPRGDLVLVTQFTEGQGRRGLFLVDSTTLRERSEYFARLFDADFALGDAKAIQRQLAQWTHERPRPRLVIAEAGLGLGGDARAAVDAFLRLLHDHGPRAPTAMLVANISILADRFGATAYLDVWSTTSGVWEKAFAPGKTLQSEEALRQRAAFGILTGTRKEAFESATARLVSRGSPKWAPEYDAHDQGHHWAAWWHLPLGLEEELIARRHALLDTIESLQDFLLGLYTSKTQQCRRGYDSSAACDLFQLGQFVKFLDRIGMVRLRCAAGQDQAQDEAHARDVYKTIAALRACPDYQLDANHSHCGPRKYLLVGLDQIARHLAHIGICCACMRDDYWTVAGNRTACRRDIQGHNAAARAFFLGHERDWAKLLRM